MVLDQSSENILLNILSDLLSIDIDHVCIVIHITDLLSNPTRQIETVFQTQAPAKIKTIDNKTAVQICKNKPIHKETT